MNKIEEQLKEGKYISTLVGNSMQPLLKSRKDQVVVEKINSPLKKYDMVLYIRDNGQYVCHRIIKIKKDRYLICGDNRYKIENVFPKQILGVVTGYYRNGKYVSCNDISYKMYVFIWCYFFPVRRMFLYLKGQIRKLLR